MIIWSIDGGESGVNDTRARAAAEASTAAAILLHATAPRRVPWDGPAAVAVTVCVDDTETRLVPCYDQQGCYDHDATIRAAHHLRDELTDPLPAGDTITAANAPGRGWRRS